MKGMMTKKIDKYLVSVYNVNVGNTQRSVGVPIYGRLVFTK